MAGPRVISGLKDAGEPRWSERIAIMPTVTMGYLLEEQNFANPFSVHLRICPHRNPFTLSSLACMWTVPQTNMECWQEYIDRILHSKDWAFLDVTFIHLPFAIVNIEEPFWQLPNERKFASIFNAGSGLDVSGWGGSTLSLCAFWGENSGVAVDNFRILIGSSNDF